MFYLSSGLLNNSAFVSKSWWSNVRPEAHALRLSIPPVLSALHAPLLRFPRWLNIPVLLLHGGFCVYWAFAYWPLPFLQQAANWVVLAFVPAVFAMDVVGVLSYIVTARIPVWVLPVIGGVVFVAGLGVMIPLGGSRTRKIRCDLAYDGVKSVWEQPEVEDLARLSDAEKNERLASLDLLGHRRKAETYIMIGLAHGCDLFIDFSLIRHLLTVAWPSGMLTFCLRVLILFPSEQRFVTDLQRRLIAWRGSNYTTRFLMGQCDQIRVVRQSSSSMHALERLREAKEMTNGVITMMREA
jgi:hypothetical protein